MGGKSPSAPQAASTAPPKPTPDANANADKAGASAQALGYAQQQAAEDEKNKAKQGLGATSNPQATTRKDAASTVNAAQADSLGNSAILTG